MPVIQTGSLSIRKSLADKGILTEGTGFKSGWVGIPTVVVTNRTGDSIDLQAGDEIGEISFTNNRSL